MNKRLKIKTDERGKLVEVFKIPDVGQVFYSTSHPGIIRGNHYHTRKKEYFCVIEGQAKIRMRDRASSKIEEYSVSGAHPELIEIPIGWVHNIQNTGDTEMKLLVWVNEVFDPKDSDTYSEEV